MDINNWRDTKAPAIEHIGYERCTGCFGCLNVCNRSAIKMDLSEEGFYKPFIDRSKCNNCGLCMKKCPALVYKSSNYSEGSIHTYAGFSNNDLTRFASSSGGIFTEAAEHFIEKAGVVYGAVWTEALGVKHIGIEKKSELALLRGSKYIQSIIGDSYLQIKNIVEAGRIVLFVGTPCQVAAMKLFSDNENLYTIDLLCHGVPSKLVFDEYLKFISENNGVESYNFRDKTLGWSKYQIKARMMNGETYECITRQDPFFHGFICDLYLNMPCYNCRFSSIPRAGDITLGDFWKAPGEVMDERGVSLVLANNEKGLMLLEKLKEENRITLHERKLEEAIPGNPRIHDGFLRLRKNRSEIISNIREKKFKYVLEAYIKKTIRYVYEDDNI